MVVDHGPREPEELEEFDDGDGLNCARGIAFAVPISLALWLLIFVLVRQVAYLI